MLTSIQIKDEDWKFCKDNGIKFSELFREALTRKREVICGITTDNIQEERRKKEQFVEIADKMKDFINKKGLIEEYLNDIKLSESQ